jgi:glycosyltransferase involved in cell wall biosynthesis
MRSVRPTISVCMATFQGEKYVAAQLRSILSQLSELDEVIVVDDHSSDGTCAAIRAIGDGRVRLIERTANQGPARAFQDALWKASGAIIFLSDQDDLWAPEKITTVLEAFDKNPGVVMVVTDAMLIDGDGNRVGDSYYGLRGRFSSGVFSNVIRCKFLGCTMAFRSELIAKALPIPPGSEILHDIWLGMVNSIMRGGTVYLDERMVLYRRHASTVTATPLSRAHQLRIRAQLLNGVVKVWMKNKFGRPGGI